MESIAPTPEESALALDAAEASRRRLAEGLELPSAFFASLGAAVAVQIGSAAVGISDQDGRGVLILICGAAVFALTAVVQLTRFRRHNGVWLAGLASRVAFGAATNASTVYVAATGAAIWAAFTSTWWLVAVASAVGGAGYALCGRRWVRIYRGDPETHGRSESTTLLALVVVAAVAAMAALVLGR